VYVSVSCESPTLWITHPVCLLCAGVLVVRCVALIHLYSLTY
jgi:hypothetical protein